MDTNRGVCWIVDRSDKEHSDNGAVSPNNGGGLGNHPPRDTVSKRIEHAPAQE